MIHAGRLNKKVTIQKDNGTTEDDYNQPVTVWADFNTTWASIEPLGGNERWRAQQVKATLSHKITIRFVSGVTSGMQVLFGSRSFGIESVINAREKNRKQILMCSERT